MKDEYRLNKEAFDRKYPGVSEGWKKDVKANKARKRQQKLEEEGRSYKLVMSPETEVSCFSFSSRLSLGVESHKLFLSFLTHIFSRAGDSSVDGEDPFDPHVSI